MNSVANPNTETNALPEKVVNELKKLTPGERSNLLKRLQDPKERLCFFSPEDKTVYKIM